MQPSPWRGGQRRRGRSQEGQSSFVVTGVATQGLVYGDMGLSLALNSYYEEPDCGLTRPGL